MRMWWWRTLWSLSKRVLLNLFFLRRIVILRSTVILWIIGRFVSWRDRRCGFGFWSILIKGVFSDFFGRIGFSGYFGFFGNMLYIIVLIGFEIRICLRDGFIIRVRLFFKIVKIIFRILNNLDLYIIMCFWCLNFILLIFKINIFFWYFKFKILNFLFLIYFRSLLWW